MNNRSQTYALFLALAIALLVRLFLARYQVEVGVDSVHYVLTGDNIAHFRGWDTWNTTGGRWVMPPIFPLLIAAFRFFGTGLEWSGHLASVLAGTLLLIPIYALTRRLFCPRTAIVAVWIAAFTPILVEYSVLILTENLFAACMLTMLVYTHRAFSEKGSGTDSFLSGFWAGLAFLTKTFGIIFIPFLILGYALSRGGHSKVSATRQVVLTLVGFMILAVPYWIALRMYTGRWVIDGKGIGQEERVFASDINEEQIDPRYSGELTADGSDFLINAPGASGSADERPGTPASSFGKRYLQKLVRIYQEYPFMPIPPDNVLLLYLFPAMLLGLGLFQSSRTSRDSDRFLLYWLCPALLGLPLLFIEVRYYVPVIPLLVPFMAKGAEEVAAWTKERFGTRVERQAVTVVVVVFILLALPKLTYRVTHWTDPEVSYNPRKVAAEWLLANDYHPDRIMEFRHSVSFYSGAQSILIPQGSLDDVVRIARKYGADLLSLDEQFLLLSNRRPELNFLFDSADPPPEILERIYMDERYPRMHHYIYRIRSPEETASLESVPN
jgi:4-amino-4-deoxy-L-arabinose transferase-like glycosyltransferase